jgi:hypothetical protein
MATAESVWKNAERRLKRKARGKFTSGHRHRENISYPELLYIC